MTEETVSPAEEIRPNATGGIVKRDLAAARQVIRRITDRKRAEEALKESEERLKVLFESAPDAYYLNDLRGIFVDGNAAAEEITGYKREELIGKSFLTLKLLPPEEVPKAAAVLAKNVAGQPTGPDEFTLNRKDGGQVTVEIRTFPVRINHQALVLGIARDVTERNQAEEALRKAHDELEIRVKERTADLTSVNERLQLELAERRRSEKALRESEANLADIAGSLKEVVWSGSPNTLETLYLNAAAEAVYGRPAAEFLANASLWFDVIHPEDKERVTRHVQASSEGDSPELEYRILRPDGEVRWLHGQAHLARDASGHVTRIVGITIDITERKQAEEALRASKLLLEKTFASLKEAVFVVDPNTRTIIACNPAAERVFGYSEKEMMGRNTEFLHVDQASYENFGRKLFPALDADGVFHTEVPGAAEGRERPLHRAHRHRDSRRFRAAGRASQRSARHHRAQADGGAAADGQR